MLAPVDMLIRERNADRAQFGLRPLPELVIATVRPPSSVDLHVDEPITKPATATAA